MCYDCYVYTWVSLETQLLESVSENHEFYEFTFIAFTLHSKSCFEIISIIPDLEVHYYPLKLLIWHSNNYIFVLVWIN